MPLRRRDFLRLSLASAAGTVLGCGPTRAPVSADALALHRDAVVLDLHIDTLLWMRLLGYDVGRRHTNRLPGSFAGWHLDLPRAREGGLDGAVLGLVINPRQVRDELMLPLKLLAAVESESGIDQTLATLDLLAEAERQYPDELRYCRSGSEVRAAIAEGRFAGMTGLEGSHGIESDLDNVGRAYDRGLRMIGLTHFQATSAAYPMTVEGFDDRGLTPFGFDLIGEMERLGMVVDLAHVNQRGVDDALRSLRQPFVVSHTACAALHGARRNLDDDTLRRMADRGGVIGVANGRNFVGRPGVEGFVDHLDHVIRVAGSESAALGTDFDGFIIPVEGMPDVVSYARVTEVLLARGHSETVVRKVLGENVLRVLTEVCG